MGVSLVLPIEQDENGRHIASKIVETVATFVGRANLGKNDVVKVTCFEGGYNSKKVYYDISVQFPPEEENEEPDYEIVRISFNNLGRWEIEPISYNPPVLPYGEKVTPARDLRSDWQLQVDVLLLALAQLYTYRAEVLEQLATLNRANARALGRKARWLKSKITDKSLTS